MSNIVQFPKREPQFPHLTLDQCVLLIESELLSLWFKPPLINISDQIAFTIYANNTDGKIVLILKEYPAFQNHTEFQKFVDMIYEIGTAYNKGAPSLYTFEIRDYKWRLFPRGSKTIAITEKRK